jgi:prephenate dehydratase
VYIRDMTSALPRIAFQGEPGAYSEDAIRVFWPHGAISVPCETFRGVLTAMRNGEADGAVLPVMNLIIGPIQSALDVLDDLSDGLTLGGTTDVPVVHSLMSVPSAELESIKVVTSHPAALAQCHRFLAAFGVRIEPHLDTAGAARMVSQRGDPTIAAVASEAAAAQYGLKVLSSAIQDLPDNWTRFVRIDVDR